MTAKVYLYKNDRYENQAILDAANGQDCWFKGPTCNHNPETTVWGHSPFSEHGKGAWIKAHDCFGCFICSDCHIFLDGGWALRGWHKSEVKERFNRAMAKSLLILLREGVLT